MFEGAITALVTPIKNGKHDEDAFRKHIDFQLANGIDGIVPCGTTGEAATMSHEEHKRLLSIAVEHTRGRAKVICGASSNCTEEALGLCEHAKKIKADAVLVVTPYYNKPTQEGLYRHFEFLARRVDIPFILYNVPSRTGVSIAPETVARLRKIPNIVGIKEASGSLDQVSQILSLCDITVLSGDDSLTLPMMSIGAKGVISVVSNVVPDGVTRMVHAALDNDWDEARKLHYELYQLFKIMFIETNPIPVKTSLKLMGHITGELRLPLCEMSKENEEKLKRILREKKVI
ncbi:MAG: 4-hydroxy-tetrahydrodipicolinate synthase [Candidatus Omnitrophica bacterium]|nr:4-hydroxy-tetrahydrodipicolinate synthase [Candidatus Omnitrophota bacterium]